MKIKVTKKSYHRNGVAGAGFCVVLFNWKDEDGNQRKMVGIVFEEAMHTAVLDVTELGLHNIEMGQGNSWRGDEFDQALRAEVYDYRGWCKGKYGRMEKYGDNPVELIDWAIDWANDSDDYGVEKKTESGEWIAF